jgi:multiple sugar transport system substrate-binding protein
MRITRLLSALLACAALIAAGCGGDDDDGGGGGKKVEAGAGENAKGNVNWCIGKDTSGAYAKAIEMFKQARPEITVKLVELPESADEQRTQLVQRLEAKSTECDVLGLDVIWTGEFAAQDWLRDVSDLVEKRKDEMIPSTLETAKFEDKYYAVPYDTNAGFIYYRTDQSPKAPADWQQLYKEAKANDGFAYQGAQYEGLTVNFLEVLYAAGGKPLSDDGKTPEVDSDQGRQALQLMVDGVDSGAAPKAVTTYMEQESQRAFLSGKVTFLRNWPYVYALGKDSKLKDDFDIATLPKFGEGEPASVVGGHDNAISAFSKNPNAAAAFIEYTTSDELQKVIFSEFSNPPVLSKTYDDPDIQKKYAFASDLKKAVEQGKARPASAVYPQISEAIYKNVHEALQGKVSTDEALKKMKSDMEKALATF